MLSIGLTARVTGRSLLGILLMQDVYLGVVVAASPMLASFDNVRLMVSFVLACLLLCLQLRLRACTWMPLINERDRLQISFLDVMYLTAWLVGSFLVLGIITAILTKVNRPLPCPMLHLNETG